MLDNSDITTATKEFILSRFPQVRQHLKNDFDSLLESGFIDSLGILEVVEFIESNFKILLSDDEMISENFETIAAISHFIQSKISKSRAISRRE